MKTGYSLVLITISLLQFLCGLGQFNSMVLKVAPNFLPPQKSHILLSEGCLEWTWYRMWCELSIYPSIRTPEIVTMLSHFTVWFFFLLEKLLERLLQKESTRGGHEVINTAVLNVWWRDQGNEGWLFWYSPAPARATVWRLLKGDSKLEGFFREIVDVPPHYFGDLLVFRNTWLPSVSEEYG